MCCLFGLYDYHGVLAPRQRRKILSVLSRECEARGTDATGISYIVHGRLCTFKRPMAAHKLRFRVPKESNVIMGHTRLTTQGSEKHNYNNHPFTGSVKSTMFALAHNGVLHNDVRLRESEQLPSTQIQTDSYIIVQLIERYETLNSDSLKQAAEAIEGSFTFTVLDQQKNLYFVKGDNPICLYHFNGFYLYASTELILCRALRKLRLHQHDHENVSLSCGEILKMDGKGQLQRTYFHNKQFDAYASIDWTHAYGDYGRDTDYETELIRQAEQNGLEGQEIRRMLALGLDEEIIEEYICYPSLFREEDTLCFLK